MTVECQEIQDGGANSSATPLVLIHDGGGTIFSYFLLGDLDRSVYGIANPHFHSGEPWSGGVPEMAALYAQAIKTTLRGRNILLGGWSFGGMLSLEIAHILQADPAIRITGLILIDSPYPKVHIPDGMEAISLPIKFASTTRADVRAKTEQCMSDARRAISDWTLPVWNGQPPPPALLLKARNAVASGAGKTTRVDLAREDPLLGWGGYQPAFIKASWTIPGSHVEVFRSDNLETLTDILKKGCDELGQ